VTTGEGWKSGGVLQSLSVSKDAGKDQSETQSVTSAQAGLSVSTFKGESNVVPKEATSGSADVNGTGLNTDSIVAGEPTGGSAQEGSNTVLIAVIVVVIVVVAVGLVLTIYFIRKRKSQAEIEDGESGEPPDDSADGPAVSEPTLENRSAEPVATEGKGAETGKDAGEAADNDEAGNYEDEDWHEFGDEFRGDEDADNEGGYNNEADQGGVKVHEIDEHHRYGSDLELDPLSDALSDLPNAHSPAETPVPDTPKSSLPGLAPSWLQRFKFGGF
jgi:hypothetical protein